MFKRLTAITAAITAVLTFAVIANADAPTYQGYPVVNVVVNGQPLQSDVPAISFNGRTLLPLRAVATAAGIDVQWDGMTQTATLTSKVDIAAIQQQVSDLQAQVKSLQQQLAAANGVSTAPPDAQPNLKVLTYRTYTDHIGASYAAVEYQNTGTAPATNMQIDATARDTSGNIVATGKAMFWGWETLAPGQKATTHIPLSGTVPPAGTVSFQAIAKKSDDAAFKLSIKEYKVSRDNMGEWHVIGTVRNDGNSEIDGVQVYAGFMDASGNILDAADSFAAISNLQPGQSSTFDISSFEASGATDAVINAFGHKPL